MLRGPNAKILESDYDVALRAERLTEYRKLWELTETLGWYGNHEITTKTAKKLLTDFDQWYFKYGAGILLAHDSVDAFEGLLLALHEYNGDEINIRQLGTKLRYALSFDIGGKNRPFLRRNPRKGELDQKVLLAELNSSQNKSDQDKV